MDRTGRHPRTALRQIIPPSRKMHTASSHRPVCVCLCIFEHPYMWRQAWKCICRRQRKALGVCPHLPITWDGTPLGCCWMHQTAWPILVRASGLCLLDLSLSPISLQKPWDYSFCEGPGASDSGPYDCRQVLLPTEASLYILQSIFRN